MTIAWKGFELIDDLDAYRFSRANDVFRSESVPWTRDSGVDFRPPLAYYLFRDLYMDALEVSRDSKRGDRIDVSARASYCEADRFAAAEMLSEVATTSGIQFVCYTETGAAFIKL